MGLGIDPKGDVAFKRLFGNEDQAPLLVGLLNAVLDQPGSVTGVNLVPPHSDKDFVKGKVVIGDIRARDQGNRQFHLEMQWEVPWFFSKRMIYYWGSFHSEQLHEGEHYMTLRPTISICFVNRVFFPEVPEHHLVFTLRESKHNMPFCDDLEVHLIQLPKFTKTAEQLESPLDRWCYFLRHGAELDLENLPASLKVPDIRRAMEVLTMFTQEEIQRIHHWQRVEAERYHASILQDAKDSAERARKAEAAAERAEQDLKEAREAAEQDLKEAREAAEQDLKEAREAAEQRLEEAQEAAEQRAKEGATGRIHLAQRILKQSLRPREELMQLPLDELLRLADALEQQLFPTNGTS